MAGSTWFNFVGSTTASAAEVNSNFDWLEGDLAPMSTGVLAPDQFNLGSTTARWSNAYISGNLKKGLTSTAMFVANANTQINQIPSYYNTVTGAGFQRSGSGNPGSINIGTLSGIDIFKLPQGAVITALGINHAVALLDNGPVSFNFTVGAMLMRTARDVGGLTTTSSPIPPLTIGAIAFGTSGVAVSAASYYTETNNLTFSTIDYDNYNYHVFSYVKTDYVPTGSFPSYYLESIFNNIKIKWT